MCYIAHDYSSVRGKSPGGLVIINFGSKPVVGNSPLNLDESSDHGLGQRYEDILMQSSGTGNLPGGIDPKTRQRFRPRNV